MVDILIHHFTAGPPAGGDLVDRELGWDDVNFDLYGSDGTNVYLIGGESLGSTYLLLDGSNADQNIDIGVHSFEAGLLTDGTLVIAGGNITTGGQITCGDIDANDFIILDTISDTVGSYFDFRRRRDGTPTDDVADNDVLGRVLFSGWYTAGYHLGAEIRAVIDGTPGSGDMPSRIEFLTSPDASATPVLAMTIDSALISFKHPAESNLNVRQ